ncbi:MAG: c-type cytochrome [Planctomycetota bacterium]|jgi:cytochrome c553
MNTRCLSLRLGAAVIAVSAMLSQAQAEGDAQAGQNKAITCVACHGQDGNSNGPDWPKLAGQHEQYLVRQMTLFKSGERQNPIMLGMMAALSPQDIEDVAAYYAGQTLKHGVADESLVKAGETLYRAGNAESGVPACMACHGPNGRGNPMTGYPAIGGQPAQYTRTTLNAFRDGAVWLTAEEIQAVASYLEGLH